MTKNYNYELIEELNKELTTIENNHHNATTYEEQKYWIQETNRIYQKIDRIVSLIGTDYVMAMLNDHTLTIELNSELVESC